VMYCVVFMQSKGWREYATPRISVHRFDTASWRAETASHLGRPETSRTSGVFRCCEKAVTLPPDLPIRRRNAVLGVVVERKLES
jgi:hypothetical protein